MASYWPSQGCKPVQLGILQEAIHGEVRHNAWNRWFRENSTGDNGTVGEADRYAHFVHGAGVIFGEFNPGKETGRNLLGPGVYLLSEEDVAVAEAYAARALGRVLQYDPKTSQRLLRNKSRKKLLDARPEEIQSLLVSDLLKNSQYDAHGNPQEEARLREVVLACLSQFVTESMGRLFWMWTTSPATSKELVSARLHQRVMGKTTLCRHAIFIQAATLTKLVPG